MRVAPTLGMVGVDLGTKPAISLAIPSKKDEEEEIFLKHCGIREFDDHNFWPTYDRDPFEAGDYWNMRHWCLRGMEFDIRHKQGVELDDVVTNFHAYRILHADAMVFADETDMNWFRDLGGAGAKKLTVDAVQELLDLIFNPAPHKSRYHVQIWMEMHRDFYRLIAEDDEGVPRLGPRINYSTDVTLAIPKIYWMCWR